MSHLAVCVLFLLQIKKNHKDTFFCTISSDSIITTEHTKKIGRPLFSPLLAALTLSRDASTQFYNLADVHGPAGSKRSWEEGEKTLVVASLFTALANQSKSLGKVLNAVLVVVYVVVSLSG